MAGRRPLDDRPREALTVSGPPRDRRSPRGRFALCLAFALAACSGAPPGPLQVVFTVDPPRPALCTEFTVTVTLRSDRPLVVLDSYFDFCHPGPRTVLASGIADGDGILVGASSVLSGATEPAPRRSIPEVHWAGDQQITCFPVLQPGRELTVRRRRRAEGERVLVEASVEFAVLPPDAGLLVLDPDSVRTAAPPAGGPADAGERILGRASVRYRPCGSLPASAESPVALGCPAIVSLYPCALPAEAKRNLETEFGRWFLRLAVAMPPFTVEEARRRAGVASGAAAWWPEKQAWVLTDGDSSPVVTASGTTVRPGILAPLIDDIGCTGRATVRLLPALETSAGEFAARGFGTGACDCPVHGGPATTVEVNPERLDEFLALVERIGVLRDHMVHPAGGR